VKQDVLPWCATHGVGAISYSPLFRGLLFGTWPSGKTFPPDDGRSTHKDYAGARFQRHLQAVEEIRSVATAGGLSVPQLCVGVLLRTPGLTGVIVGARDARQGGLISSLGVSVTEEQANDVWAIVDRLTKDLATM
jgi:aryl-alcohol dehydrogenase-like predicted oxidoreductase